MDCYLIVGIGNPGKQHENTRHNLGFSIVQQMAKQYRINLKNQLHGYIGSNLLEENRIFLLLPTTYVNESGRAVQYYRNFFQISMQTILIIVDDLALPFGTMRLRQKGSSGGHNGLKSIEKYLGTQNYARLRIGIGKENTLIDKVQFVLEPFAKEEQKELSTIIEEAIVIITTFISEGEQRAKTLASLFQLKKKI